MQFGGVNQMEVVCMDAMEFLDSFEDDTFDLIFLDPDYQDWDALIKRGLIEKAIQKIKPTGNILCFTKQPFDYALRVAANKWFRREIAWTFENGGAWCSPKMPLMSTQKIYWLVKDKKFFFNPRTGVAYNKNTQDFKRSKKVFGNYEAEGRAFVKSEDGIWLRDHLHYNKPNSGKIPAKPRQLIEILCRCFCPDGGMIADPFTGSGAVVDAAQKLLMDVCACDINNERVDQIISRYFVEAKNEEERKNNDID